MLLLETFESVSRHCAVSGICSTFRSSDPARENTFKYFGIRVRRCQRKGARCSTNALLVLICRSESFPRGVAIEERAKAARSLAREENPRERWKEKEAAKEEEGDDGREGQQSGGGEPRGGRYGEGKGPGARGMQGTRGEAG